MVKSAILVSLTIFMASACGSNYSTGNAAVAAGGLDVATGSTFTMTLVDSAGSPLPPNCQIYLYSTIGSFTATTASGGSIAIPSVYLGNLIGLYNQYNAGYPTPCSDGKCYYSSALTSETPADIPATQGAVVSMYTRPCQ